MTSIERSKTMSAVRWALSLTSAFALKTFRVQGADHFVVVAAAEGGLKWRCERCRTAGAYYDAGGLDVSVPLARFVCSHTGERCPC